MSYRSGTANDPITLDSDDDGPPRSYGSNLRSFVDLTSHPSPTCSPTPAIKTSPDSKKRTFPGSPSPETDVQISQQLDDFLLQSQIADDMQNSNQETGGIILSSGPHSLSQYDSLQHQMVMAACRASRQKDEAYQDITKADFEKKLQVIQESARTQHASSVQRLLCDARSLESSTRTSFKHNTSPFANMAALNTVSSTSNTDSGVNWGQKLSPSIQISQLSIDKTDTPLTTARLGHIIPEVKSVPPYQYYVHITRNIYRPDDDRLHFMPYLGDYKDSTEFEKKFRGDFDEEEDPMTTREAERAMKANNHLDEMLDAVGLTRNHLYQELLNQQTPDDNEDSMFTSENKACLQKALAINATDSSPVSSRLFTEVFNGVFKLDLYYLLLEHDRGLHNLMILKRGPGSPVNEHMSTYTDLLCMICHTLDCPTHRRYDKHSGEEGGSFKLQTRSLEASISQRDALLVGKKSKSVYDDGEYCSSNDCYLKNKHVSEPETNWTSADSILLASLLEGMPLEPRAACIISMAMPRHLCWDVQRQISKISRTSLPSRLTIKSERLKWFDPSRKRLLGNWEDLTKTHRHESRYSVKGCQHEGPCSDENCSCVAANVLCEKLCACAKCAQKFTGCACRHHGKACFDNRCICQQLNRECDPDLCGSCGAVERADPQCQKSVLFFKTGCQNVELQIANKITRNTVIGRTKIFDKTSPYNFFGLYAGEDIPEGAFIDEYVGQIISHYEAGRWGELLDRLNKSYLFDLNACEVIDSQRMGNHTRFINHEKGHRANTTAKVVLVNLIHRIKFTAIKNIKAGSELFFDYGEGFTKKHKYLQTEILASKRKAKTLNEKAARERVTAKPFIAEEAVDDGFDVYDSGTSNESEENETRRTRYGRPNNVKCYTH